MKLLDRLLIVAYIKAYLICLVSLLSLYIVIDLFTNIDDFSRNHDKFMDVMAHVATFYGARVTQIFDRLCEGVVLLAAMFTVAWVQRNNELVPLLSAGVSTRRMVRPVLLSACAMLGVTLLNQEILIPRIAPYLLNDRDDPRGDKDLIAQGAYEPNGIHIEGGLARRRDMVVRPFNCAIPEPIAPGIIHLHAAEARYIPPGQGPRSGGWWMTNTQPAQLPDGWHNPDILEMIDPGNYFLYTQEVTFHTVTRNQRNWYTLLSTSDLRQELSKPVSSRPSAMAVLFHLRLTRPVLGILLVCLGLSIILRDQNRNVFISAAMCLIVAATFFAVCLTCKHLGDNDYIFPALAAWLPVLIFGPIAFVTFDAIHT
ncbi:MAG: LptF/LptG family permease [Gemmataceae bacterium]